MSPSVAIVRSAIADKVKVIGDRLVLVRPIDLATAPGSADKLRDNLLDAIAEAIVKARA
jgi:hypothetical protein